MAAHSTGPDESTDNGSASADGPLASLVIVAVDDDVDVRDLVGALLESEGATVVLADCAREGLDAVERYRPHVLVSDIGMPHQDGHAMLRELRARDVSRGAATPAIALTAYSRPQDVEAARAAGFQVHLAKPVDPDALVAAIVKLAK